MRKDMANDISNTISKSGIFSPGVRPLLAQGDVDRVVKEILGNLGLIIGGGFDTTTALTAHALEWLSQHPEQRARLSRERADLLDPATEEFLRYFTPAPGDGRTVAADCEIDGIPLAEGERLWISWAMANRDPAVFENPNEIILDRKGNRHFSFGLGVHRCIGSNVARTVFKRMLIAVFDRMPDFVCDPAGTVHRRDLRRRAEDLAESVSGVTHVQNNLRVSQGTGGTMGMGTDTARQGSSQTNAGGSLFGSGTNSGTGGDAEGDQHRASGDNHGRLGQRIDQHGTADTEQQPDQAQRHVEQEDPAPGGLRGDQPAQRRPDHRPDQRRPGDGADGLDDADRLAFLDLTANLHKGLGARAGSTVERAHHRRFDDMARGRSSCRGCRQLGHGRRHGCGWVFQALAYSRAESMSGWVKVKPASVST